MTKLRALLAGVALAALALTGVVWAQTTTIVQNLTGNELLTVQNGVGGPGGSSFFTTVPAMRNATGYIAVATGGTVNTTIPTTASRAIATGAITTWNITFPTAPFDGQMIQVSCPGGTATVAMTATLPSGVVIVGTAFTTCTTGGAATAEWIYSVAANTWYRTS